MQYLKLSQLVEMVKELETAVPNSNNVKDVENRLSQADMWIERFAGNEDFFEHPLIINDLFTLAKLTGDRDNPYTALWTAQDHNAFAKLKEKWPNRKTALLQEIMYCKEWKETKMVKHYPEIKELAEIAAMPIYDPSEKEVFKAKRTCYTKTIGKVRQLAPDIIAAVDEDLKGKFTDLKLGRYDKTDKAKCVDGYCYDIMGYKGSDLSNLISGYSRRRRLIFGYEKKTKDYFLNKQIRAMDLHNDDYCDFGGHLCDILKKLSKQVNRPNFFEAFLCVFLFVALRNELREVENAMEAHGWLPPQEDSAKLNVVKNSNQGNRVKTFISFFKEGATDRIKEVQENIPKGDLTLMANYFDGLVKTGVLNGIPSAGALKEIDVILNNSEERRWRNLVSYRVRRGVIKRPKP